MPQYFLLIPLIRQHLAWYFLARSWAPFGAHGTTLLKFAKDSRAGCQNRVSKRIWRTKEKTSVSSTFDAITEKSLKPLLLFEAGFQEAGRRKIISGRYWYERLRFSSRR